MSLSFKKVKVALDVVLRSGHVPNIVGLQGIGKSDLVREYAEENGYGLVTITCSLVQEGDMAMPYITKLENGEQVHYAINTIISSLQDSILQGKYKKGILFLDEFNRGTENVQSELMNLVLQREIAGYKLDDRLMVVLAMNPNSEMVGYENTDYSVSFSDNAILGRMCTLNLKPILSDWLDYGKRVVDGRQLVHQSIITYLSSNANSFITKETSGKINNTPRGWKRASDILYTYQEMELSSKEILKNLLEGTLDSECIPSLMRVLDSEVKGIDYLVIAKSILDGSQTIMHGTKSYTDLELDKIFKLSVQELYNMSNVPQDVIRRFVDFILSVNNALSYSWVETLSKDYSDLYEGLVEYSSDFSNYVLDILNSVKGRERGGFNGK